MLHFRRLFLAMEFIFDFQHKNRSEKMKPKDFLTTCIFFSLLGTFSGAKSWTGESVVTAVQGESVTLTWNVSLTGSHASKTWTYVKILHAEGANTDELVTFKRTEEKVIDNPSYSSRRSDMTFNVSQSGLVVTIRFTIANLLRSTDMKNYKAVLGFTTDASTYPSVTTLTILVRPRSTEFTIKPLKNSFCIGDQVNLTCKADAIPPAQISLLLNDHLVQNGNTSVTLSLTLNVKGENNFICVPNNTAGTGQTRNLKRLVQEPPKIARCWINGERVQSKSFNEGTKVTLSCDLTGSEPLDVAWNKVNEQNSLSQTNTLTLNSIQREQSGQYRVTVYGPECEKKVAKLLYVGVMYLDRPVVHGNTYEVVSSKDSKAEFKVTVDGNPQPSLTCDREGGGPGNVSVTVSATSGIKSTFLVRIYATNDEEYNCNVRSAAGNRHLKLKLYKQIPTAVINGTFTLKNKTWTDDLYRASSDAYVGLKTKVTRALNLVYGSEKFVSQWRILGFVKGSVAVNFQLDIIANVTDPIALLKNAVEKNGGQLNGLSINSNSIKTGYSVTNKDAETDARSKESKDNIGAHVGIGVGVSVTAIVVALILVKRFCCNKNAKKEQNSEDAWLPPAKSGTGSTNLDAGGHSKGRDVLELENVELKREYPNGIIDSFKADKVKVPVDQAPKLFQGLAIQQGSTAPQLTYP